MRVCLVSAPTATDFEDFSDAQSREVRQSTLVPQLGVLTLAGVLDQLGIPPFIVDLNRCYYNYLEGGGSGVDDFAGWAADAILATAADVYGFSSICSSYPISIRIAEHVKRSRTDCVVLFGGPQASVVDTQSLIAFPFVDYILRGEADETLSWFLDELSNGRNFSAVPGLTWRTPLGPCRNVNAPVIYELDALPFPAYHITGELAHAKSAPLEIGRGCPFACTFCSTSDFFRRSFRVKSPQRVLAEMRWIASTWGVLAFELNHDMFAADRRKVVAFCECMLASREEFTWGCSARTDCVDQELLELMARAGCRTMFLGIESGSQRMQALIEKDLDVGRARQIVLAAERLGIDTTVSLITGFPEETWQDVRDTVGMYMYALGHPRSTPQLNLLAPLAETSIHATYRNQLMLEQLCSDMSHQGRSQNLLDRDLIRKYPEIFPNFYLLPVPHLDRDYLLELREFLLMARVRARWLMVALYPDAPNMLDAFSAWRKHRMQVRPGLHGWEIRSYYTRDLARTEFARFICDYFGNAIAPAVECLASFDQALASAKAAQILPDNEELAMSPPATGDIPVRAPGIFVLRFDWDVQGVIDCLKRGGPVGVIDRSPRFFRTQSEGNDSRVMQTTPLIAAALAACNGRNTVTNFLTQMQDAFDGPDEARRVAAECLLDCLIGNKLIYLRKCPPSPHDGGRRRPEARARADAAMAASDLQIETSTHNLSPAAA